MIERECPVCGTLFKVWPSRVKHGRGVHCSKECQYIANREKLTKPKLSFTCIGCGTDFEKLECIVSKQKGGGKYCSRECRDIHWIGEKNPNWQNGDKVYKRGSRWHSIRRRVLKRDNGECQHCGSVERLHVHHKIPFRMFDDPEQANHEDNLISLCPPCHRKEDAKYKWAIVGGTVSRMEAGSPEWKVVRAKLANDNTKQEIAV